MPTPRGQSKKMDLVQAAILHEDPKRRLKPVDACMKYGVQLQSAMRRPWYKQWRMEQKRVP